VDDFFNELHVLDTRMIDLSDDHLLQISISRLKEDIRNKIKLIYIKDVEQLQLKSKVVEEKLLFFQRSPWSHSKEPSSNFTPTYKGTPPANIEDENNSLF
jgi:hypothetical protein